MKDKSNLNQNPEVYSVISSEDWENALTPDEFLAEAKKMLRRKFEERSRK